MTLDCLNSEQSKEVHGLGLPSGTLGEIQVREKEKENSAHAYAQLLESVGFVIWTTRIHGPRGRIQW